MEKIKPFDNLGPSVQLVVQQFQQRYDGPCRVFRAPGRVNLIGEHTEYNDGFVIPAALDFYTYVAAGARRDHRISVHSVDFDETVDVESEAVVLGQHGHWVDYPRGVAGPPFSRGGIRTGAH